MTGYIVDTAGLTSVAGLLRSAAAAVDTPVPAPSVQAGAVTNVVYAGLSLLCDQVALAAAGCLAAADTTESTLREYTGVEDAGVSAFTGGS